MEICMSLWMTVGDCMPLRMNHTGRLGGDEGGLFNFKVSGVQGEWDVRLRWWRREGKMEANSLAVSMNKNFLQANA
eukprot:scaffold26072_cov16-Tisochrysis_lutea.AAC.3